MPPAASHLLRPFVIAALVATSASVFATAQRTFVSSAGNDANACSITSPCRGFATAVAQTNAGGEVIVLDSAGYGPVIITKSISIFSPAGIYGGVSVFSGDGVTINAPGAIVVLRGLSINGQGGSFGIRLQDAARVRIENCVISNMSGNGIQHAAIGAEMIVLDTIVRDNSAAGIAVLRESTVVLDHVRSEHNGAEGLIITTPPNTTLLSATIANSVFAANGHDGISVTPSSNTTANVQVESSVLSHNGGAGFAASASSPGAFAYATLTRNTIGGNGVDGILMSASSPGKGVAFAAENSLHAGPTDRIHSSGDDASVYATANTASNLLCDGGGFLFSYGNNVVFLAGPIGCYSVRTGL